ncbi:hypothetical protein M0R45_037225 [Rubus argutus]|uniref:DUF674 domain-containing protein n=1 Tax=Rubus argutus TaxID=59490 RepID=A0AAW1W1V1_RUBAR
MATSNNTNSVSLKLLIDTKGGKVLFAEASKEVVDFLFTLLSLPVGTVVRLLTKNGMDSLLKPNSTVAGANILHLTYNDSNAKKFYICQHCNRYISDGSGVNCPRCNYNIATGVTYVAPSAATGKVSSVEGYVKGVVTYMVMDNLEVKPMSTISSITALNKFNIKEVGALEEKVVTLGMEEGLKLLKASLEGNAVLTKVFLGITYLHTYMYGNGLMDDLEVMPMSTISNITLLNKFNVATVGDLEEKVVHLSMQEGMSLFKASLKSNSVLTDVLLGNKAAR